MKRTTIKAGSDAKYNVFDATGKRVNSFEIFPEREISDDFYESLATIGVKSFNIDGIIKTDTGQSLAKATLTFDLENDAVFVEYRDEFNNDCEEYTDCWSFDNIACEFQSSLSLVK